MSDGFWHQVKQGECIGSLALRNGIPSARIWDHPENAELKRHRATPNVLFPGDRVFIPFKITKEETINTGRRHRFKRKAVPTQIKIRLLEAGRPRVDEAFHIDMDDGSAHEGRSDADGYITFPASPAAACGRLEIDSDLGRQIYTIRFGHLYPIDTAQGVKQRLVNLGYACPESDDPEALERTVKQFQGDHGLEATGQRDAAILDKLKELHGS